MVDLLSVKETIVESHLQNHDVSTIESLLLAEKQRTQNGPRELELSRGRTTIQSV